MNTETQNSIMADIVRRYRSGHMPRRDALRLLTGLGLSATGIAAIGVGAISTRATSAPTVLD
ncbi:MAG: hypothetical protein ACRDJC_16550, partial [Thermomicrobiales bacterium]